jgi:Uncharacterized protein conserved in bacteria
MDIAVIADDFTGANANGALLTAKGFSSATCLGPDHWNPADFSAYTAVSLNAESRLLPQQKAWQVVYDAVSMFCREHPALCFKAGGFHIARQRGGRNGSRHQGYG